ncbi:MAG: glycosyltransferase family 9 protein [Gammaproteobacteria bacterium]
MENEIKLSDLRAAKLNVLLTTSKPSFLKRVKNRLFGDKVTFLKIVGAIPLTAYLIHKKIKIHFFCKVKASSLTKELHLLKINSDPNAVIVAFVLTGGIGDFIVHRRAIRDLLYECPSLQFDIYTNAVNGAEFVFNPMRPHLRRILQMEHICLDSKAYDTIVRMHHTAQFISKETNIKKITAHAKPLANAYHLNDQRLKIYTPYLDRHPEFDIFLSETAVTEGYTRENLIHHLLNITYRGHALNFNGNLDLNTHQLISKHYITIHNGWDVNYRITSDTATKNYPDKHWIKLVALLKQYFPDTKIVQLGAGTSRPIPGVDLNLIQKTSLSDCAEIIKHSALHIDSESGLVHMATSLGVKSIVLFGPTNAQYFSYNENINLVPSVCHNCWYLKHDWMANCPRGFKIPACLDSLLPEVVAQEAVRVLNYQHKVSHKVDINYGHPN